MSNRQVKIDFQAQGIKEIIRELDKLQEEASKIKMANGLEDQFKELASQADSLKEALNGLQQVMSAPAPKKKDERLTDMEKKIDDMKKSISSLTDSLAKANEKIDGSMAKVDTAIGKLNSPKLFEGLLSQLNEIHAGFEELIRQANEYRTVLSQPISVEPKSIKKAGKQAKSSGSQIEELKELLREDTAKETEAQKMSGQDLSRLLKNMNSRLAELDEKRRSKPDNVNEIEREMLGILKQYSEMINSDNEEFGDRVDERVSKLGLDNLASAIRDKNRKITNKETGKSEVKTLYALLKDEVRKQVELLAKTEPQIETTKEEVVKDTATVADYVGKKTEIKVNIGIADNQQANLEADLQTIINTINASNPHIDVKLNFVSGPTVKNRGF